MSTSDNRNKNSSNVRVAVRVRPLTTTESSQGGRPIISVNCARTSASSPIADDTLFPHLSSKPAEKVSNEVVILGAQNRRFTFDEVFDGNMQQDELYDKVSGDLLKSFLEGFNATIMAYGQTGSGKTYTMGSEHGLYSNETAATGAPAVQRLGLIPRFLKDIFQHLHSTYPPSNDSNGDRTASSLVYTVTASFLEVYGEDVHDLLGSDSNDSNSTESLPLREDSNGTTSVIGLQSLPINSANEAMEALHRGTLHRTTASTLMNMTSSRSHAIFIVQLRTSTTSSAFTFVDLAGSERLKKTGAVGTRAREGIHINKGLLALGNVINALADEERISANKPLGHVPYRQSKLTRLLRDALGGNSRTLFLACVSPSDTNASETLSTLRYANRARNIRNAPICNMDENLVRMKKLQWFVGVLQWELVKREFVPKDKEEVVEAEDLMQRGDVQTYLKRLYAVALEKRKNNLQTGGEASELPMIASTSSSNISTEKNVSTDTNIKDLTTTSLVSNPSPSPEEDIQILDTLLTQLQSNPSSEEPNTEDSATDTQIHAVNNELAEQEQMLLQLRDHLAVYHSIKERYESLLVEVQSLEQEKQTLAAQLERMTHNPDVSNSIRKKLERVEANLSRARHETKTQQDAYRKMEAQAHKCRALEQKISQLKQHKANLMRQQKRQLAKHKQLNQKNNREIIALKKQNRQYNNKNSKLEQECRRYRATLERRKGQSHKLTSKLKQTEDHLLKLLRMRKKELQDRYFAKNGNGTGAKKNRMYRMSFCQGRLSELPRENLFAEENNTEYQSAQFVLNKMVSDRVERDSLQALHQNKLKKYEDAMRQMSELLDSQNQDGVNDEEKDDEVEGLQLQLELLGNDLEDLRGRLELLGHTDKDTNNATDNRENEKETNMVAKLQPHILRTLLWNSLDQLTNVMMEKEDVCISLKSKDAAFCQIQEENEEMKTTIQRLSRDFVRKTSMLRKSGIRPEDINHAIQSEERVKSLEDKQNEHLSEISTVKNQLRETQIELSNALEKIALHKASDELNSRSFTEQLEEIQGVYRTLGVSSRNDFETNLTGCINAVLVSEMQRAHQLQEDWISSINRQNREVSEMCRALRVPIPELNKSAKDPLVEQKRELESVYERISKDFRKANARAKEIKRHATDLIKWLGISVEQVEQTCLKSLLLHGHENKFEQSFNSTKNEDSSNKAKRRAMLLDVENIVNAIDRKVSFSSSPTTQDKVGKVGDFGEISNVSEDFLQECSHALSTLRRHKAGYMKQRNDLVNKCVSLISDTNLSKADLSEICHQWMKRNITENSDSDQVKVSEEVMLTVFIASKKNEAMVHQGGEVSLIGQLQIMNLSLKSVAGVRRTFSSILKKQVEHAHSELLRAVQQTQDPIPSGPDDDHSSTEISEALQGFETALLRLPPLSKELINTCIRELRTLAEAADNMSQSEIEALMVIWETLDDDVSVEEREQFWVDLEDGVRHLETIVHSPFEDVLVSNSDDNHTSSVEEWVHGAVREATKAHRLLSLKLFKLGKVHADVERNRSLQEIKSRILTIDSEIRINSIQLKDFEDKAGIKKRLTNKKTNSSSLLKEERFRKHAQKKVAEQLVNLGNLLQQWQEKNSNGNQYNLNVLSKDVRSMLQNHHKNHRSAMDSSWVMDTTALMHLRTTSIKRKLSDDQSSNDNSSISSSKRPEIRSVATGDVSELGEAFSSSDSDQSSSKRPSSSVAKSRSKYSKNIRSKSPLRPKITVPTVPKKTMKSPSREKMKRAMVNKESTVREKIPTSSTDRRPVTSDLLKQKTQSSPVVPRTTSDRLNVRGSRKEFAPRSLSKSNTVLNKRGTLSKSRSSMSTRKLSSDMKSNDNRQTPSSLQDKATSSKAGKTESTNAEDSMQKKTHPPSLSTKSSKRTTIMPFGDILGISNNLDKENEGINS